MRPERVFLAAPFKALIDERTGEMQSSFKRVLTDLIDFVETRGYHVHSAHRREAWGRQMMTAEECTRIDFDEIAACDVFVALPGSPASPGTHIEIGWASALGKRIVLLLEEGKEYAYLVQGLHTVANVVTVPLCFRSTHLEALDRIFPDLLLSA